MATKKTEVATTTPNGIALSQDTPEWAKGGTGRGSENVGTKDLMLPRLEIIQSESPIKEENPEARDGLMFNTVTGDLLGDTVFVVPIYYRMEYLVWKDQDSGGGFFGAFDTLEEAESRRAEVVSEERVDPELLEIVDTPVHYCLRLREDGGYEQIVLSMPKSKAKVSRKWNSVIQLCGGDRFSRAYKVTTFKDKNRQGKTFQNYVVSPAGFPSEAIYKEAGRLYEVFRKEGVKTDHATRAGGEEGEGSMDTDQI